MLRKTKRFIMAYEGKSLYFFEVFARNEHVSKY